MNGVTKSAETPVGKDPEARPSCELMVRRIKGGSDRMKMVLEAWIIRAGPERRIQDALGCGEEEIADAARSVAKCWMANGMEEKARRLIETYGLDENDVRSSSLPPAPVRG